MKSILLFLLTFISLTSLAQTDRVIFEYDSAGNQIVRRLCLGCLQSRNSNEEIKEITDLEEKDLLKFSPSDVISYYPNPVKDELFLKWELINENKVSNIEVFSLSGQLIRSIKKLEKENSQILQFQYVPVGTYLVLLSYTNGEQKSITIIKK